MPEEKLIHYYVAAPGLIDEPTCIHAKDQEDAVKHYLDGDNPHGYNPEDFEYVEIQVVAASKVTEYRVDIEPPTKANITVTKVK